MAVGFDQVQRATPTIVRRVRDAFMGFFVTMLPFGVDIAQYLNITISQFNLLIAVALASVRAIASCFGISDETELQRAKDVLNKHESRNL